MEWADWLMPTVPIWELLLRGSVTFLLLYFVFRIVGRRESGSVGLTDVLVIVVVANAATAGMTGGTESVGDGFVLVFIVLFWSVALDALGYFFPRINRITKSGPKELIRDGNLVRKTMRREFMTADEVRSQLRLQGIEHIGAVERAYLEPNGEISVISNEEHEHEEQAGEDSD